MAERTRTAPPRTRIMRVRVTDYERLLVREIALREQKSVSEILRLAVQKYSAGAEVAKR